jgi:Icc-related predicted phosphoesterase
MKLTLVHISDWHGAFAKVPWADAYFITGDMLKNYPEYTRTYCELNDIPWIEPPRETFKQSEDVRTLKFRKYLGNPDAPIYIVRGNHDFVYLSRAFDGGPVFEFDHDNYVYELEGLRIGGFRGVTYLEGDWSDEMKFVDLCRQVERLPKDIDILLTHAPPRGIMDKVGSYGRGPNVGIRPLVGYLNSQAYKNGSLRLHCFGHIHENFGTCKPDPGDCGITYSNAATGYIKWEWDGGVVTLKEAVRKKDLVRV